VAFAACKAFAVTGDLILEILHKDTHKEYVYYLGEKEIAREAVDLDGKILLKSGRIPDGLVRQLSDDGQTQRIWNFKNNKRNGVHREYFENGKIKFEGTYRDDVLTGKFKSLNEGGAVEAEGSFDSSGFTGIIYSYTSSGIIEIVETYREGELFTTREYFRSGELKNEWSWKDGLFHGTCRTFYENGKIASLDTYKNGLMVRREVWDESGNSKFCRTYTKNDNQNHAQSGQERGSREQINAKGVRKINLQQTNKGNNINLHK
jgi:antitoxin component YwqK of YwqJK toxin-antitoxin module